MISRRADSHNNLPYYRSNLLRICAGHIGGRGGIRTHGQLAPTLVFKTSALVHYATLPWGNNTAESMGVEPIDELTLVTV